MTFRPTVPVAIWHSDPLHPWQCDIRTQKLLAMWYLTYSIKRMGQWLRALRAPEFTVAEVVVVADCFYVALFSALEQTHCARIWSAKDSIGSSRCLHLWLSSRINIALWHTSLLRTAKRPTLDVPDPQIQKPVDADYHHTAMPTASSDSQTGVYSNQYQTPKHLFPFSVWAKLALDSNSSWPICY